MSQLLPWRNIRFGVELEGAPPCAVVTVARSCRNLGLAFPIVGYYGNGGSTTEGWSFANDGDGLEVRTPILEYKYWNEVRTMLEHLLKLGVSEGSESGLHVHLDVSALSYADKVKLLAGWWTLEPTMFTMVEPYRLSSGWCEPLRRYLRLYPKDSEVIPESSYKSLTRACVRQAFGPSNGWNTFECRIHHSTFTFREVFKWVTLLQILCSHWLNSPMPTVAQLEAAKEESEATQLMRLQNLIVENTSGAVTEVLIQKISNRWRSLTRDHFNFVGARA